MVIDKVCNSTVMFSGTFPIDMYKIVILDWDIKALRCWSNEVTVCVWRGGARCSKGWSSKNPAVCSGHFWKIRCQDFLVIDIHLQAVSVMTGVISEFTK